MPMNQINNHKIILDESAAIIGADDYIREMVSYLRALKNVVIFENTEVKEIRDN